MTGAPRSRALRPARGARHRARRGGFTLLELMVALTIASIVILAVFSLGGASSRHFHEQQRIGEVQRGLRMGIDWLRRDIARAGYGGVPDTQSPFVRMCPTPAARRRVAAVWFQNDDSTGTNYGNAALNLINRAANATSADRLILTGNYLTGESYLVRSFDATGGQISLQTDWLGFRRSFVNTSGTSAVVDTERFGEVFAPGRMLHIETPNGFHFVVDIASATVTTAGTLATVNLSTALGASNPCLRGFGRGSIVTPLSEIEYFVGRPDLAALATPTDVLPVTGENIVLYRQERDMTSNARTGFITGTRRALVEYVVDFNLDFVIDTNLNRGLPPTLVRRDGATAQTTVQNSPWQVRGVIASVAARTPEQYPRFAWPAGWSPSRPTTEPLTRYQVFADRPGAARVRQLVTEVQLPNMLPR